MLRPIFSIDINTHSEKLCKIYLKKLFFQNVLGIIDLSIDINNPVISFNRIVCDVM